MPTMHNYGDDWNEISEHYPQLCIMNYEFSIRAAAHEIPSLVHQANRDIAVT